jgi:hypothetical protein
MIMKRIQIVSGIVMIMAALQLGGCAGSYQARNVDVGASPLVNPDILQKGGEDQALYRYVSPKADLKKYKKIIIDPVVVRKDGELDAKERENYQTLANNAYVYLAQELGKDYQLVNSPEPGAMRLQTAIIDADNSKPVRNTLSTFMPIGMGLSAVRYGATGKMSGVGEITAEMKLTDAETGELLGAALDRRVGGKDIQKLWSAWANADDALKYWAGRLSFVLCEQRGGSNCTKPQQ